MRVIALALAMSSGAAATSLAQDAGVLRIYQAGLEVGRETFRDDGLRLETSVTIPLLKARIASVVERDSAGRMRTLDERIYVLPPDTLARSYTATIQGDSVHLTLPARSWARHAAIDEFGPDQSLAPFLRMVQSAARENRAAPHSWRVWLPSADSTYTFSITFTGDTATGTLGPQSYRFVLGADGRVSQVEVPASRIRYERFQGDSLPPLAGLTPPRPDYSAPAGASYTAEEVRVPVTGLRGDTFSLGCTLTKPHESASRLPAAITLTGSGQQDRDENLYPLVPDYHLFRQVAERLAGVGIAVLRCDDYGYGASGGPIDTSISMLDFANAAKAQLAWLRTRADIDGNRLAIIGHSEGGIVGPMVAADDRRLGALVIMAGTAKTMDAVLRDQFLYAAEHTPGITPEQRDSLRAQALRQVATFGANAPGYMRQARTYDPLTTARRVRAPTLILQGAVDRQVSAGQADTLAAAMRAAGNRDVTEHVFPGLNHLFLVSPSGSGAPDEYATLRDAALPDLVLGTLADWLRARLVR